MRQLTLTLLSLIAIASALFAAGPRQALACSCAGIQPTEQFAREAYAAHDLAVIGTVRSFRDLDDGRVRAEIGVISTFGFVGPDELTVVADRGEAGCGYGEALRLEPDDLPESHFMMLTSNGDDEYYASYCSSFEVSYGGRPEDITDEQMGFLNELSLFAPLIRHGRGERPASFDRYGSNNGGASFGVIATYAAGSLAALAALWVLSRKLAT